jgi:hypothetical protein
VVVLQQMERHQAVAVQSAGTVVQEQLHPYQGHR